MMANERNRQSKKRKARAPSPNVLMAPPKSHLPTKKRSKPTMAHLVSTVFHTNAFERAYGSIWTCPYIIPCQMDCCYGLGVTMEKYPSFLSGLMEFTEPTEIEDFCVYSRLILRKAMGLWVCKFCYPNLKHQDDLFTSFCEGGGQPDEEALLV